MTALDKKFLLLVAYQIIIMIVWLQTPWGFVGFIGAVLSMFVLGLYIQEDKEEKNVRK